MEQSQVATFIVADLRPLPPNYLSFREHIRELNDNKRQHSPIVLHIQDGKSFIPSM